MKRHMNKFIVNGNQPASNNKEKQVKNIVSETNVPSSVRKTIPEDDIVVTRPQQPDIPIKKVRKNKTKNSNNKVKIFSFIILLALGLVAFYFIKNNNLFYYSNTTLENYPSVVEKGGMVFVCSNDEYSISASNTIKNLLKGSGLKVYKLEIILADASPTALQTAEGLTEYTKDGFVFPSLLYFSNGELVAHLDGMFAEDTLLSFIHDNNIEG